MMYKKYQKVGSFILSLLLVAAFPTKALAASNNANYTVCVSGTMVPVEEYDSDWMYNTLSEIGFTNNEMFELYQKEADKTGVNIHLPDRLARAMGTDYVYTHSNLAIPYAASPQDGDEKYDTYEVAFRDLALYVGLGHGTADLILYFKNAGVAVFQKAVISVTGLAAVALVLGICHTIFSYLDSRYEGFTITIKSVYNYDEYERLGKWYMVNADYYFWK